MVTGTIQRTAHLFRAMFDGLSLRADVSWLDIEKLAIMVHKAMTDQSRSFHTPEHIFDLTDASNPIHALAALFHDVVYYQVDQGFIPEIHETLAPYIEERNGQISLVDHIAPDDVMFALTLGVFGFVPGQIPSPFAGLNEFLSALLMNKKLEGIVADKDLLKTTACIEATIAFRGRNSKRETPADVLERRLSEINAHHAMGMDLAEIRQAVKWAVAFSNNDVHNFAEQDTGKFLDNTWKLIPEANPALRSRGVYSIRSYRQALQGMEEFLRTLNPEDIFNCYHGEPPEGEYQRMVALAHRNVFTAREYMTIKLLASAILEALATITGGDAPVALFMGDIEGGPDCHNLGDLLPDLQTAPAVDVGSTIFGLLAFGRASASSFDMQNSPLSLFLYKNLAPDEVQYFLDLARDMFDGDLEARAFLNQLPTPTITAIANSCAKLAITRSEMLKAYAASRAETLNPAK